MSEPTRITGFRPYYRPDSRILVLGSFPSVQSRAEGFYYGNRQNRFWRTLATAFGQPIPATVPDKKALLDRCGVALWDVVISCEIVGSMDKNIRNYAVADLSQVLNACRIEKLLCNGQTAGRICAAHFPQLAAQMTVLPSTSPANGRFSAQKWVEALTFPHTGAIIRI